MFRQTFYFKTVIPQPLTEVWKFFQTNKNLAKITKFPKISILGDEDVFEGSTVHLQLNFTLVKLQWKGKITKVVEEAYFIDEADRLPFPFKSWKHVHEFKEVTPTETNMIDRVEYEAYVPTFITNLVLKGMFSDRKKQLKKKFG